MARFAKTPTSTVIRVSLYFLDGGYRADNAFGFYNALYKLPRSLYTKSTPSFIYFVVRGKIGGKENMTTYQSSLLTWLVGISYATRKL